MRQVDGAGQEVDEPFRCVAVHVVSQEHDDDEPLCKGISGASGIPVLRGRILLTGSAPAGTGLSLSSSGKSSISSSSMKNPSARFFRLENKPAIRSAEPVRPDSTAELQERPVVQAEVSGNPGKH